MGASSARVVARIAGVGVDADAAVEVGAVVVVQILQMSPHLVWAHHL